MLISFQILLSIAAVISLALGFFQDFGPGRVEGEPPVNQVEGVAIIVAIFIVVCVFQLLPSPLRAHLIPNFKGHGWLPQRLAKGEAVPYSQRREGGAKHQGYPLR